MKINSINLNRKVIPIFITICFLSLSSFTIDSEKEKSIQVLLEDLNPSLSFSFSKNIIDFFDTDLDWKEGKKQLEGDFSKAAFYAFDEHTSSKTLHELFSQRGYNLIKIADDGSKNKEIQLFVNKKSKEVEEAHFIIQSDEKTVVFSLYGKMKLKEKN